MKKNNRKNLKLARETLRYLDLSKVAGATWSWSCGPETRGFTNCEYCDSYTIQIPP
jgi:hypothetical protein